LLCARQFSRYFIFFVVFFFSFGEWRRKFSSFLLSIWTDVWNYFIFVVSYFSISLSVTELLHKYEEKMKEEIKETSCYQRIFLLASILSVVHVGYWVSYALKLIIANGLNFDLGSIQGQVKSQNCKIYTILMLLMTFFGRPGLTPKTKFWKTKNLNL